MYVYVTLLLPTQAYYMYFLPAAVHAHSDRLSVLFLFAGGCGLSDPCENGVVDASAKLSAQERANITLSAQVHVRSEWIGQRTPGPLYMSSLPSLYMSSLPFYTCLVLPQGIPTMVG